MTFFELTHQDQASRPAPEGCRARAGVIHTDHGDILTPAFMPVGTQASVKTLDQTDLESIKAPIILGNTYHLHLRPGEDLIAEAGGLHKFMNWNHPILTDSGGFQVFSLGIQKDKKIVGENNQGKLVKIDDDGVTFTSHIDGSTHRFTPETSIEIQHKLGADIIMAFDECTPDQALFSYARQAMERTHQWAERSLAAHRRLVSPPSLIRQAQSALSNGRRAQRMGQGEVSSHRRFLFGIIQGGPHQELRRESARAITALDFDGIAIGGESIGYNMEATKNILDWIAPILPVDKPRYTMGVGLSPVDLLTAVAHGADMFDCVSPTRLARHGMLFTFDKTNNHRLNIKNARFRADPTPIDAWCDCSTCQNYSRSYLHHLFAADELTGLRLATIHNLRFFLKLMEETRVAILEDGFGEIYERWKI